MSFRKLPGVCLPEEKQGLIRYTCLNYAGASRRTREKVERLCRTCGGEYEQALFEVMTTRKSITSIALAHYVSETTLYRLRKSFYEAW